jgi:hypothetical protein
VAYVAVIGPGESATETQVADAREAGRHTVLIPTGLGELRNGLVVRAADAVLAIGGSWGTLSEVALAARTSVPVVSVGGWEPPEPGVDPAPDIAVAVDRILSLLDDAPGC